MFIYLATPYSDPEPRIQELRYKDALAAADIFVKHHIAVYSPIVHWHPYAVEYKYPGDHDTWWIQDKAFLLTCREAWFLQQEGSHSSLGMDRERRYAIAMGKQIVELPHSSIAHHCRRILVSYPTESC